MQRAEAATDLEIAEQAYRNAGATDKAEQTAERRCRQELDRGPIIGGEYERQERWEEALTLYQRLAEYEPDNMRWRDSIERVTAEQELSALYKSSVAALAQSDRVQALQALALIVHRRPTYKDAAVLLTRMIGEQADAQRVMRRFVAAWWRLVVPLIALHPNVQPRATLVEADHCKRHLGWRNLQSDRCVSHNGY